MVQRLIDAGYQMTVYDRTREIAQEVAQKGAKVAERPRELAASCDVILSSVTNDAALEEVMYGPDGVLAMRVRKVGKNLPDCPCDQGKMPCL